jgi:hypothetical protein
MQTNTTIITEALTTGQWADRIAAAEEATHGSLSASDNTPIWTGSIADARDLAVASIIRDIEMVTGGNAEHATAGNGVFVAGSGVTVWVETTGEAYGYVGDPDAHDTEWHVQIEAEADLVALIDAAA